MTSYGFLIQRVPDHLPAYRFMVRDPELLPGPVTAFTWSGIRLQDRTVRGYRFDPARRRWVPGRWRLPDVILNRSYRPSVVGSRLWELRPRRLFNSHLWISKWTTWRALQRIPELQAHLPPTCRLDYRRLFHLLQQYGSVYLKPYLRTHGRGIIKVWRAPGGGYAWRYKRGAVTVTRTASGYARLVAGIRRSKLSDPYLIQKDIRPAQLGDRRFDFRVFAVRRPDDSWVVTGSFARLAPNRAVATNRDHNARGIRLADTGALLAKVFGQQEAERIWREMQQVTVSVCRGMARHYRHMAVFGLDLGVDQAGQVWLFEANAHPQVTRIPGSRELAAAIWDYAKSL